MGKTNTNKAKSKRRPAMSPEERVNQIISASYDLAEQQIRDGTASSQVITHFLKLGTAREQLELERLRQENSLTKAKIENLESTKRVEELYKNAIDVLKTYRGEDD